MDAQTSNLLVMVVALIVVALAAGFRFNTPVPERRETRGLMDKLREPFRLAAPADDGLAPPARAATTAFKYRVHQGLYIALALLVFLFIYHVPDARQQLATIFSYFGAKQDTVRWLSESGALVLAAFVVLVLPVVPPFRWADQSIRRALYHRAAIPAQQWRECSRLKLATYRPDEEVVARVRVLAVADGFAPEDMAYQPDNPTTASLWSKAMLLMHQLGQWETDDRYKTAFAVLREGVGRTRSVDALRETYTALKPDARVCLAMLRGPAGPDLEAERERERQFRERAKQLLMRIYHLFSRVSLHAHYSERERLARFQAMGWQVPAREVPPLPDINDLVALGILLGLVLVLPLASGPLGLPGAVMVALIMYSAVLTPIVLARFCPGLRHRAAGRHTPPLAYPVVSGVVAALLGMLILSVGGNFVGPTPGCAFSGFERFANCSYPWSFLHAGMAALLAWRMTRGEGPAWFGRGWLGRIRQWFDPWDGLLCMAGMIAVFLLATEPALEQLWGETPGSTLQRSVRVGLVGLVMGGLVPTWFRGYGRGRLIERRRDPARRARFAADIDELQQLSRSSRDPV